MSWFRKAKQAVTGPPEGAHGQRNIDGSYFSIWKCQHGHGNVGEPNEPPDRECMKCAWAPLLNDAGTDWALCSPREARDYLFEIEGFGMYSGVGFKLMESVRAA